MITLKKTDSGEHLQLCADDILSVCSIEGDNSKCEIVVLLDPDTQKTEKYCVQGSFNQINRKILSEEGMEIGFKDGYLSYVGNIPTSISSQWAA